MKTAQSSGAPMGASFFSFVADVDFATGHFNDLDNARLFVQRYGNLFRYVPQFAMRMPWMLYDGQRWARDERAAFDKLAHQFVGEYRLWAHNLPESDADYRDAALVNSRKLHSRAGIKAMVELAQGMHAEHRATFGGEPYFVNVLNGVVDLRTGDLLARTPDMLLEDLAPIAFDPAATCPTWTDFVTRSFGGNTELTECFQRYVGQALFGLVEEKAFAILHGPTDTGKSIITEVLSAVFGTYAQPTRWNTFAPHERIPDDLAKLQGKRFILVTELPRKMTLAMDVLKRWTGGDAVPARVLYGEWFEFRPAGTLLLTANALPRIPDPDSADQRRVTTFPTTRVSVPEFMQRPREEWLADLMAESAGIFNWLMAGYREWQDQGLNPTVNMLLDKEEYLAGEDTFKQTLRELAPDATQIIVSRLWDAWNLRQLANGLTRGHPDYLTMVEFGRELTRRFGPPTRPRIDGRQERVYTVPPGFWDASADALSVDLT